MVWSINFKQDDKQHALDKKNDTLYPKGFAPSSKSSSSKKNKSATVSSKKDKEENNALKLKKAWEAALAPAKSIPMNLFMV
jgi:hypothetical protein